MRKNVLVISVIVKRQVIGHCKLVWWSAVLRFGHLWMDYICEKANEENSQCHEKLIDRCVLDERWGGCTHK